MLRAYNYRLYPTPAQADFLNRSFGSCRWVYNWALGQKMEHYQREGKTLNCFALMKQLPALKQEHEWLGDVPSQALQQVVSHLDAAFQAFFKKSGGFPKFKSRHRSRASFSCPQGCRVDFEKGAISIPKCPGIRAVFSRLFEGTIKTVTVSRSKSGRYFASVLVDDGKALPAKAPVTVETSVGLDVGIKHFATLSTGEKIENPKYLRNAQARLKVLQRRLSRKEKGSRNRDKARLGVARLHEHIARQRQDFLHQVSTRIIRENQTVIVEDLNVAGMLQNHGLARAVSDCGWARFKEFLRYKCEWYGRNLVEIGRFLPSSNTKGVSIVGSRPPVEERVGADEIGLLLELSAALALSVFEVWNGVEALVADALVGEGPQALGRLEFG